jgi:anti-sigma factor RsiW
MNCGEAQEQLSAFHDRELSSETRKRMSEHLESCSECACALAQIEAISDLTRQLSDPKPPADLWARIENELVVRPAVAPIRTRKWRWIAGPQIAVSLIVLFAVGWFVLGRSDSLRHQSDRQLARHFGQFVDRFQSEPEAAAQMLLTNYAGQRVSASQATTLLGYQPVATRKLPSGYSFESVVVLEMPCCRCPQTVYRRDTGGVIAIFEHNEGQPSWFGQRPQITACCSGASVRLVQLDTLLAATWKHDLRYLTVIGADDVQEIASLINHFRLLRNEPLPT